MRVLLHTPLKPPDHPVPSGDREMARGLQRLLKRLGCRDLQMVCLVAAPEGVQRLLDRHPEVPVFAAALDRQLDENAYIRPGLGDAGDRIFGTVGA